MKKLLIIIAILGIALSIAFYFVTNQTEENSSPIEETPKENVALNTFPTSCTNETEGVPVITGVSTDHTKIGEIIKIDGCNFSGFEGDTDVWIQNTSGEKGFIKSEPSSSAKSVTFKIQNSFCKKNTSYSGEPCDDYLEITKGTYIFYASAWGKKSQDVMMVVE